MSVSSDAEREPLAARRFIVQKFAGRDDEWVDVACLNATDAGAALKAVMVNPQHRIQATTYRVSEEALLVKVSINLEAQ